MMGKTVAEKAHAKPDTAVAWSAFRFRHSA